MIVLVSDELCAGSTAKQVMKCNVSLSADIDRTDQRAVSCESVCINVHSLGYQQQSKQEFPLHHAFPAFHASDECQAFPNNFLPWLFGYTTGYSRPSPKLMCWTTGLRMTSLLSRGRTSMLIGATLFAAVSRSFRMCRSCSGTD